jgi:hypothetical protein
MTWESHDGRLDEVGGFYRTSRAEDEVEDYTASEIVHLIFLSSVQHRRSRSDGLVLSR